MSGILKADNKDVMYVFMYVCGFCGYDIEVELIGIEKGDFSLSLLFLSVSLFLCVCV